jgi:hypothetical protein
MTTDRIANYVPGDWFLAHTLDEMERFYLSRLPSIREAARLHGYSIGLHGSCRRDLDLVATVWVKGASDKDTLAHAIAMAACGITRSSPYVWEAKPYGRVAVSIPVCWTDHANPDFKGKPSVGHIDLSLIDMAWQNEAATAMAQFVHLSSTPDQEAWGRVADSAIGLLNRLT